MHLSFLTFKFSILRIWFRNDNHAQVAEAQLQVVAGLFTKIDSTLGKIVLESKTTDLNTNGSSEKNRSSTVGKKRKISDKENESASPAKKANMEKNGMTLSQREEKAMNQLATYLEQRGGMSLSFGNSPCFICHLNLLHYP